MNDNNEKLVFELKDLSYADLISLYRTIIDFNKYLDSTIKSVIEEPSSSETVQEENPESTENSEQETTEKLENADNNENAEVSQ